MSIIRVKFIISITCFLISSSVFSLNKDKDEDILLFADNVKLDTKHKKSKLKGNVKIQQGSATLKAASASTISDNKNNLLNATANGDNKKQAKFTTKLENEKALLTALADTIIYMPRSNQIHLKGNAKLIQGANSYQAPFIIYDMKLKRIISHNHGKKHRTRIFIKDKVA